MFKSMMYGVYRPKIEAGLDLVKREKCPGASKMETKDENPDTDTMTTEQLIRGVAVTISYTTTSQPSNSSARDTVLATKRYQGAQDLIIHEGAK
jgi:hypothetical protein